MKVNGKQMTLNTAKSLKDFLQESGYVIAQIAVERNGEIVKKESLEDIMLQETDVIEVVSFVGGG